MAPEPERESDAATARAVSTNAGWRDVLTGERCSDPSEVVVTVAHGMILKDELAGERSIAIERYGSGAIQLFIAELTYCRCGRSTVLCQ